MKEKFVKNQVTTDRVSVGFRANSSTKILGNGTIVISRDDGVHRQALTINSVYRSKVQRNTLKRRRAESIFREILEETLLQFALRQFSRKSCLIFHCATLAIAIAVSK